MCGVLCRAACKDEAVCDMLCCAALDRMLDAIESLDDADKDDPGLPNGFITLDDEA